MRLVILPNHEEVSIWTAHYLADKITKAPAKPGKPFVLGLPTGSSPIGTYKELISMYKKGKLSFANVVTFNMDEYIGLPREHPESYYNFMWNNLFSHVDIPKDNVHILNGMAPDLAKECEDYEAAITQYGGIDLFLGGVGTDGHLAFNMPGASLNSRTRKKALTSETVRANARFFDNDTEKVPKAALTVGVATVMDAREVVIIVTGYSKARALREAVEEGISHKCPLSVLQMHRKAIIVCDDAATEELRVGTVRYYKSIEG